MTLPDSSSSDTDDMPLSVVAARSPKGRGKGSKGTNGIVGNKQSPAQTPKVRNCVKNQCFFKKSTIINHNLFHSKILQSVKADDEKSC